MKSSKHHPPVGHRTKYLMENQRRFKNIPDHQRDGNWYTIKYRMGDNPMPQHIRLTAENKAQAKLFAQNQLPSAEILD